MEAAAIRGSKVEERILGARRRYSRAAHVQQAVQAGTTILFDGRKYFTLTNETATELWALLAEPRSAEELVGLLYDQYDASREVITADVTTQLAVLQRERLVVQAGGDGEPLANERTWWRFWRTGP